MVVIPGHRKSPCHLAILNYKSSECRNNHYGHLIGFEIIWIHDLVLKDQWNWYFCHLGIFSSTKGELNNQIIIAGYGLGT